MKKRWIFLIVVVIAVIATAIIHSHFTSYKPVPKPQPYHTWGRGIHTAQSFVEAPEASDYTNATIYSGNSGYTKTLVSSHKQVDATQQQRDIIRTGHLNLQVKAIPVGVSAIKELAKQNKWLITSSNEVGKTGPYSQPYANITLRVPVAHFDDAMGQLSKLADKILSSSTQANDITRQIDDSQMRLKNLKSTVAGLEALKAKAKKMSDLISLTSKISDYNGQIQRLEQQLANQKNQVAMSTIHVSLALPPKSTPIIKPHDKPWSYSHVWTNALHTLEAGLKGVAAFITVLIVGYLPIFIIVLVVLSILWWLLKLVLRRRRK